ncbi:hypothetical protein H632_c499p1, partial [Helicosporidium sp. ATCC 50920]
MLGAARRALLSRAITLQGRCFASAQGAASTSGSKATTKAGSGPFELTPEERESELELFHRHNTSLNVEQHLVYAKVVEAGRTGFSVDPGVRTVRISRRDAGPESVVRGRDTWLGRKEASAEASPESSTSAPSASSPSLPPRVRAGDDLVLCVRMGETPEGGMLFSRGDQAPGASHALWKALEAAARSREPVRARILNAIHGGFAVGIAGVVGFLPGSECSWDTAQHVGELVPLVVSSASRARQVLVFVDPAAMTDARRTLPMLSPRGERARTRGGLVRPRPALEARRKAAADLLQLLNEAP